MCSVDCKQVDRVGRGVTGGGELPRQRTWGSNGLSVLGGKSTPTTSGVAIVSSSLTHSWPLPYAHQLVVVYWTRPLVISALLRAYISPAPAAVPDSVLPPAWHRKDLPFPGPQTSARSTFSSCHTTQALPLPCRCSARGGRRS